MGLRTGFVYKTEDDLIANYQPGRSVLNGAFSVVRHACLTGGKLPG